MSDNNPNRLERVEHRPRRAALLVAVAVAAAGLGVAACGPGSDRSPQAPAPAPSIAATPTWDRAGEQACKELEKLYDRPKDETTHLSSLATVAIIAVQASDEEIREEGRALRDALKVSAEDSPTDVWLRAEMQTLNLIGACDDANYAF